MPSFTILSIAVAASVLLATGFGAQAAAPAIACAKPGNAVDREICGSPELLAMDREIAALYDRGQATVSGEQHHALVVAQQSFLRRRGGCGWASHHSAHPGVAIEECVRGSMEDRIRALRRVADRGRF